MRKRIAIVVPSLRGGGAEKVIVNLLRHFDLNKFEIKLFLVKKEGPYLDLVPEEIPIINLNSNRARYSIAKLTQSLNEYRPEVILSTLGYLNLILILIRKLLKGNPKIIVRHAISPTKSLEKLTFLKRFYTKLMYKILYKRADIIIAQCEDMKKDISRVFKIDKEKIERIYNPISINEIRHDARKDNPYVYKNRINILAVGRLTHQKGFDILLKAFKEVNLEDPNTHLTIIGEGDLREALLNQIKELDIVESVSLLRFQKNPYPFYYFADLYVLSSRYEGFPNTLLEALACGTKVIATDCMSGPKEIIGNNKYGELVPIENHLALAKSIKSYMQTNNKTQNRAEFYDIKKIVKEYEEILFK